MCVYICCIYVYTYIYIILFFFLFWKQEFAQVSNCFVFFCFSFFLHSEGFVMRVFFISERHSQKKLSSVAYFCCQTQYITCSLFFCQSLSRPRSLDLQCLSKLSFLKSWSNFMPQYTKCACQAISIPATSLKFIVHPHPSFFLFLLHRFTFNSVHGFPSDLHP